MPTSPDTWVIIPAYNEEPSLGAVLDGLAGRGFQIVIVDDGSTDQTADVALKHPVLLVRHACNLGQGAALQTGIAFALRSPEAGFIVTFDADGQHSADDIPRLVEPLRAGSCDVCLGSRFTAGGKALNISSQKRILLLLALTLTRWMTGLKLTDTHNGLRAFTRQAAGRLNITQDRMAHASQILSQIATNRLRYREIPVTVTYSAYSVSKGQGILDGINVLWEIMFGRLG